MPQFRQEPIDLGDLAPIEIPYKIGGKLYALREPSGAAAAQWKNSILKATKVGADGRPSSMEGMGDTEAQLVSLCLFEIDQSGGYKPVPLVTVRSWKYKIVSALFDKIQEIGGLRETDTRETLVEKMDKLKEQLAALENGEEPEGSPKNLVSATKAGSS